MSKKKLVDAEVHSLSLFATRTNNEEGYEAFSVHNYHDRHNRHTIDSSDVQVLTIILFLI